MSTIYLLHSLLYPQDIEQYLAVLSNSHVLHILLN